MSLPTILIADDDASTRRLLSFCLRRLPVTLELAADGAAALARLRQQPIRLLITDNYMPGMDGLEVVRAMRDDTALRETPVLMLSATGDVGVETAGRALGVRDFFSKPFSPSALAERVQELLRS